jgi:hypothetical protein
MAYCYIFFRAELKKLSFMPQTSKVSEDIGVHQKPFSGENIVSMVLSCEETRVLC